MVEDKNLTRIKKDINAILPDSRIILFGSRNKDNFDKLSDYDILVVVKQNLVIKEKRRYASLIRKRLSKIPLDVIIKTEDDLAYYRNKIGSLTREAILEGVSL